ncbi:MAG: T9SS type A sorting domain-containing protein [Bacteroidota bacterium]
MKQTLSLLFVIISSISFAQKIEYSYSPSGNRTIRKYSLSPFKVGLKDSAQSVTEFPKILMQEGISVFPNPTNNNVTLTINEFKPEENNSISIINAEGRELLTQKVNAHSTEINVSNLVNGVYFFKVIKNKNILYYKLVKIE